MFYEARLNFSLHSSWKSENKPQNYSIEKSMSYVVVLVWLLVWFLVWFLVWKPYRWKNQPNAKCVFVSFSAFVFRLYLLVLGILIEHYGICSRDMWCSTDFLMERPNCLKVYACIFSLLAHSWDLLSAIQQHSTRQNSTLYSSNFLIKTPTSM